MIESSGIAKKESEDQLNVLFTNNVTDLDHFDLYLIN
jgi:hypothetical protein